MEFEPEKIFPSELERDDAYFMAHAYNRAVEAFRADEVPVGAVVVCDGEIIASAHNEVARTGDPTAHAEILAITQAARHIGDWRLNACTLYVTKEPCPMCSGATVMARLGRVVYAFSDPKMGLLGGAADILEVESFNHHPLVEKGVLEEPALRLMRAYFGKKRRDARDQA